MMKTYIKAILEKRKNLPKQDYILFSEKICQKVLELKEYQNAENVLAFYPYLGETDILPIVQHALSLGKNVFFPKVTGDTTMEFIKVSSMADFSEGYKGIKEPIGENCFNKLAVKGSTCMLTPGSSFDRQGNRTGYGKGYYDRYLADCYDKITKIGVCFSLQMLEKISDVKETDIPMDYVIDEKNTIRSDNKWKC